jgi:hypothetical protein
MNNTQPTVKSETPRTDAKIVQILLHAPAECVDGESLRHFARQLERELNQWREVAMELAALIKIMGKQLDGLLNHDGCPSCCNAPKDSPEFKPWNCLETLSTLTNPKQES